MKTRLRIAGMAWVWFCLCAAATAQGDAKEPIEVDWKHDWRKERRGNGQGTPKLLKAALT